MRTLQIVGNARFGGATTLMLSWSRFLVDRGCDVEVLCTDERMKAEVLALPGVILVDDIFIPKEIDPWTDIVAFARIARLCRARRYDVVHTYTAAPSFVGRLAATVAGVGAVVNHQGGWAVNELSTSSERLLYTPLEYLGTLACTRNICVSHAERAKATDLRLAPDRKLVTIANGIDIEPFVRAADRRTEFRAAHRWDDDTTIIGTTGRLVPGKGNDTAIKALRRLIDAQPGAAVVLALAGDGDDRADLVGLATDLGVADRVQFLGFVEDIPGFLAAIDIFTTPTHTEGLSVSILEAMAAAKPVVATDIPPNVELVHDRVTGLVFNVDDEAALSAHISSLLDDPQLGRRLGAAGRDLVADSYSQERMFEETWSLYHQLGSRAAAKSMTPI